MTDEGVTLVMRVALVLAMIVSASVIRTLVGPSRRRGGTMLLGTLGGISFGVLLAYPVSQWLGTDVSVFCASFGVVLGWAVSWRFARRIPREAS
jgi:hypothetical protein